MAEYQQQDANSSYTYEIILLRRTEYMMNSAAEEDVDKYFTNFRFAMQLVLGYLNIKTRTALEQDYKALLEEFKKIKEDKTLNPEGKKIKIRELKQAFADGHTSYIFACFSKVGIQKLREEGKLDFSILDIDQMAQIVRGREKGLIKTMEKVIAEGAKE